MSTPAAGPSPAAPGAAPRNGQWRFPGSRFGADHDLRSAGGAPARAGEHLGPGHRGSPRNRPAPADPDALPTHHTRPPVGLLRLKMGPHPVQVHESPLARTPEGHLGFAQSGARTKEVGDVVGGQGWSWAWWCYWCGTPGTSTARSSGMRCSRA